MVARDHACVMGRESTLIGKQPVVAIDRTTGEVSRFDVPDRTVAHMVAVFESDAGVYIQTKTALYFRRNGSSEWIRNEVGHYYGCQLSIPSPTGEQIEALCKSGSVRLISNDNGRSWQKAARTVSQ